MTSVLDGVSGQRHAQKYIFTDHKVQYKSYNSGHNTAIFCTPYMFQLIAIFRGNQLS
jgi:hypothetical protein